jgi:hypothetical protein
MRNHPTLVVEQARLLLSEAESSRIQQTPHNHADTDFQKSAQSSPLYCINHPSFSDPTGRQLSLFSTLALASASPHEISFPHLDPTQIRIPISVFCPLCIISYLSDQDYFLATCIYLLSLVMFVFWPGVSGSSLMLDRGLGGHIYGAAKPAD